MRYVVDLIALAVAFIAVLFSFYGYYIKSNKHPIEIVGYDMPKYFVKGEENAFTIMFYKNRDDCSNPTIRRTIINVDTGSISSTTDKISGVLQYPVKTSGKPHKIRIITTPSDQAESGESFIITDICHTCLRQRLCLPSSSPTFLMRDGALAKPSPLSQNESDIR